MTDADNGMNPLHFGSDPADIRIRMNPKIRIRIPDHLWLKLYALAEDCCLWELYLVMKCAFCNVVYSKTNSSAVAKRLRDASCLPVVSFNSTIPRAQFFYYYLHDFKFTSTYNSILFCCIRRNIEPCCHTHDSRTTMNVYSARARFVGHALYTVTDNLDCVHSMRVALGRPIPVVNRKPVAKCKIQTRV